MNLQCLTDRELIRHAEWVVGNGSPDVAILREVTERFEMYLNLGEVPDGESKLMMAELAGQGVTTLQSLREMVANKMKSRALRAIEWILLDPQTRTQEEAARRFHISQPAISREKARLGIELPDHRKGATE